jgi:hypothetical protein
MSQGELEQFQSVAESLALLKVGGRDYKKLFIIEWVGLARRLHIESADH